MASSSTTENNTPQPPTSSTEQEHPATIATTDLTYRFPDQSVGLSHVTLSLPAGSRTLLVGANGSGKTTLLRLLAGKRLAPRPGSVVVCGTDPFSATAPGVAYLGLEWVLNSVVRRDVGVAELLASVGGDHWPARRDELVSVLDVDVARWRLHAVSDGERRRVQLALGLLRPWRVLLLDEVTVDLDVLSRRRLLDWLRRETEERQCTVVYATHVLDSLAGWPTHLVHLFQGQVRRWGEAEPLLKELDEIEEREAAAAVRGQGSGDGAGRERRRGRKETGNSRLGELALRWLEEDLKERGPRSHAKVEPEGKTYDAGGLGGYGDESMHYESARQP